MKTSSSRIHELISKEKARQQDTLMLIPSENYTSDDVMFAVGSVLGNKYAEGYPHRRYYQGNEIVDIIEIEAIEKAQKLFGVSHTNVQPYSGSPANSAILFALAKPNDTIMGLELAGGGHLTHGHPNVTFSGTFYTSVQYKVNKEGHIDMKEARKLAKNNKPVVIFVGTTAYPRNFDWKEWRSIADECGAYLVADISHIAGLIAGKVIPSPVPYVDVLMTTTHKTLRGPRGAMIMVTENGIKKDPEITAKIDRAVFPGLQGGPHMNAIAGIAVALEEALQPSFATYAQTILDNATQLAQELTHKGLSLVTGGTDNHLMVIDLTPQKVVSNIVAEALEIAHIVANRNSIPHDPNPPFYPSGLRIGTPAMTTRGLKPKDMKKVAEWIVEVITIVQKLQTESFPSDKDAKREWMQTMRGKINASTELKKIAQDVTTFLKKYPM